MAIAPFELTHQPLEIGSVVALVTAPRGDADASPGAVATFLGQVRGTNMGRRVVRLEYESYEPLAVRAFERIAAEAQARWAGVVMAIHHRLGQLAIGEPSVVIAAAAPHRAEAFAACRYAIERIKQIAPIWKHEFFEGGDTWIEGASADPDDAHARDDAFRRACA